MNGRRGHRGEARRLSPVLPASLAVVVTAFALGWSFSRLGLRDPWDHAGSHAVGTIASVALIVLLGWKDRSRDRPKPVRLARMVLLVGLGAFAVGQVLEFAGAFGAGDTGLRARIEVLHDLGILIGVPGLLVTMLGALLSALMWVAARLDLFGSRWLQAGIALALVAVALFVAGAFIFGY